jgi:tRNA-dihydrouridine synthase
MYEAGKLARSLGFDGVDINMGCPAGPIVQQGAGIALCKTPGLAQDLIRALREGAGDLPVSVKTRLGLYKTDEYTKWIAALLETRPDALIIHGRTMKEMSKVPAHWDVVAQAAALCHQSGVVCVGNGDVMSHTQGMQLAQESNVDGIMIGRGIFHNPWIFNPHIDPAEMPQEQRIALLRRHIAAWEAQWHPDGQRIKSFDLMKKFFKVYISGWAGAATLRASLMECRTPKEALDLLS